VPIVLKSGSLSLLEPSRPVQACNGIALFVYTCIYREMFILYLTENTVPAVVRNSTKRNAGSLVLPGGKRSDRWALEH